MDVVDSVTRWAEPGLSLSVTLLLSLSLSFYFNLSVYGNPCSGLLKIPLGFSKVLQAEFVVVKLHVPNLGIHTHQHKMLFKSLFKAVAGWNKTTGLM